MFLIIHSKKFIFYIDPYNLSSKILHNVHKCPLGRALLQHPLAARSVRVVHDLEPPVLDQLHGALFLFPAQPRPHPGLLQFDDLAAVLEQLAERRQEPDEVVGHVEQDICAVHKHLLQWGALIVVGMKHVQAILRDELECGVQDVVQRALAEVRDVLVVHACARVVHEVVGDEHQQLRHGGKGAQVPVLQLGVQHLGEGDALGGARHDKPLEPLDRAAEEAGVDVGAWPQDKVELTLRQVCLDDKVIKQLGQVLDVGPALH